MIYATILGTVSRDAEIVQTKDGKSFLRVNIYFKNGSGANKDNEFCSVIYNFTNMQSMLVKGTRIVCNGILSVNKWKTQDGTERKDLQLNADRIEFASFKQTDETHTEQKTDTVKTSTKTDDTDLPF